MEAVFINFLSLSPSPSAERETKQSKAIDTTFPTNAIYHIPLEASAHRSISHSASTSRLPRAGGSLVVRHEQLTCHCVPTLLHSVTVYQAIHNTKLLQIYQHTLPWDRLYSSSYLSHIFTHHCLELTPYRHTEVRLWT